jgi:hypothetical protein
MKFLKVFLGIPLFMLIILSAGSPFSSCMKTVTIHDTTTVVKNDTTIITDSIYDLTDGLVAYFNFNGASLKDSSGYGNNISFSNAIPTTDRFGNANNAFLFGGDTSYMIVPNNPSLNPVNITLMAIIKFNAFDTVGTCFFSQIFMKGSQDPDLGVYGLRLVQDSGACQSNIDTSGQQLMGIYGDHSAGATLLDGTYPVHTNTWITLVYTYDGRSSKIYINGQLSSSTSGSATFNPNAYNIYIGETQNPSFPYHFFGVIDEIRIYNRALGGPAVKQLSNQRN